MTYEFADRLIELRKDNGMSQEELAQRIGLSRQAVSKWERAESSPDIGNLVALAEIYGLTIDDIVKGTSTVPSEADEEAACEEAVVTGEAVEEVDDRAVADEAAVAEEAVQEADDADVHAGQPDVAGQAAQPDKPTDDVSKMPPPDPSQRVDWADAATWHAFGGAGTQAPPPGHPFGGHRAAPDSATQPFAAPGSAAQSFAAPDPMAPAASKPRKPAPLLFPYPVLCAFLYLVVGFAFGLWHPCWIIFLTIPFYYWIANVVVNDPLWRARHGYLDE